MTVPPPARRSGGWAIEHVLLALLALVPVLAARSGVTTSDTKTYLYLDPSRFLGQVASMWYPTVALGTVTHQYVGYLFPMGPYYALLAAAHVPTWVAQRLWLGGILYAAGAGVLFLFRLLATPAAAAARTTPATAPTAAAARTTPAATTPARAPARAPAPAAFPPRGLGPLVAALAYMLSPYVLQYSGRISVILLPWAGLPWLVAFTVLAVRRGGWRYPALFALVIALTSGINASSVLYVVVAPVLWIVYAVAVERECTWRSAGVALARIAALSLLVSAWWIVGLAVEAGYGVDILRYTESVPTTSSTSTPIEVLRGLGYWYFYGSGRLGPWTQSAVLYTKWVWLVALSYAVPVLAFAAAALTRWRHRTYFVSLVVVGVVLSVGAYPYSHPSPFGSLLRAFMTETTAGLAMRSTDRATPLALLGLAMLLGAGVSALHPARRPTRWMAGIAVAGMVVANNPALFNGDEEVVNGLTQPSSLPSYELAALHHLQAVHPGTRVLAIPGNDFAAYTWGDTTDTPQPAFLTRPFVTREQQVMGSMATADTLYAMDAPIQTATEDWSALAPMARLLSAGNVLVEYDQDSALYGIVPAGVLAHSLRTTPRGLTDPRTYGRPGQGVARPTLDPEVLAATPGSRPPPLATYAVSDPRPVVRGESDGGALVVAGDATGLESLAAQGLLGTTSAIYYAGTLDTRPAQLRTLVKGGATLVVTDTNRKEGFRWNSLTANTGYIEEASQDLQASTPSDSPIDLFPGAPMDARTLGTFVGAADITASSYGNPVTYTPEDRPYSAIDDNLRTAWETGTFTPDVDGQWWQAALGRPVVADHLTLVQARGTHHRHITKVTLTFTGRSAVTARLGRRSLRRVGQVVSFRRRRFRTLRITIDSTSNHQGTPVGFAEVRIPGVHVTEVDQLPTDLLRAVGTASLHDRLVFTMTRARVSPYSQRSDPETTLSRAFTLPTARTFSVTGTATLSSLVPDDQLDRLLGVPGATGSGVVAFSSGRLTGDLAAGAGAAADGNPATYWQPAFGARNQRGAWLQYDLPEPVTFDHLTLEVVADRRHSVPAAVTVTTETHPGTTRTVALPLILRHQRAGTIAKVRVDFPTVSGRRVRVSFPRVHMKRAALAGGARTEILPIGIAEVGIPGVSVPPPPRMLPATCTSDLLSVDGRPVTVEVAGPTATALGGGEVSLLPCGADASGLRLSAGHHVVETALATTPAHLGLHCAPDCGGWNVDTLTLSSAPGGGPEAPGAVTPARTPAGTRVLAPPVPGPSPVVRVTSATATATTASVRAAHHPFELVMGQSIDAGWHAVAEPARGAAPGSRPVTLGRPELVDGFANGWQVSSRDLASLGATATGAFTVQLTWTPQRFVWAGIALSAATLAGLLALVLFPARRKRRPSVPARREIASGRHARQRAGAARWAAVAVTAVLTGAAAAAISTPVVGPFVAVAVAVALVVRRCPRLPALVAAALLAAAAAMVVVGQAVHPSPGGGGWPGSYHTAAAVAAAAVAFLGADAVVDYRRAAARRRQPDAQ